jgi:hypothetical protein
MQCAKSFNIITRIFSRKNSELLFWHTLSLLKLTASDNNIIISTLYLIVISVCKTHGCKYCIDEAVDTEKKKRLTDEIEKMDLLSHEPAGPL